MKAPADARQIHHAIAVLAAIGLAAALTGCSAGALPGAASTSPATPATPATAQSTAPVTHVDPADPCALVTEANATAALGADPGPGVPSDQGAEHLCTYGTYPTAIAVASTPTNGKLTFDAAKRVQGHKDGAVDLTGVGNEAFGLTPPTNAGSAAYFYKGNAYVSITLVLATPYPADSPAPKVVAMAKAAAARL